MQQCLDMTLTVTLYTPQIGSGEHAIERWNFFVSRIDEDISVLARTAGVYDALFLPERINAEYARQLIGPIFTGLTVLNGSREFLRESRDEGGKAAYDAFVPWLEKYLSALRKFPGALIEVQHGA